MLTVVRREVYPMDMKILFILLVLLFLPTSAGPGGPLDGAWHDQSGNTIVVRSEVVHATVWFQSSDGRSETVRARYTGYTALDLSLIHI